MRWPRWTRGRHRPTKTDRACRECSHPEVDHYLNDGCYGSGTRHDYSIVCDCLAPFPGCKTDPPAKYELPDGPLVETWESSRTWPTASASRPRPRRAGSAPSRCG